MIVAFDTSTALTSVALVDAGEVVAERLELDARRHAEVLAPMLESILDIQSAKFGKLAEFAWRTTPEMMAKRTGIAQIGVLDDDHDWTDVYFRHHRVNYLFTLLSPHPPYVNRLGGALDKPNPLEHMAGK